MIVIMMDAKYISERLSSLKNEMSDLRGSNTRYWNRKGHTPLQKSLLRYGIIASWRSSWNYRT
jgi:hypothetical protein